MDQIKRIREEIEDARAEQEKLEGQAKALTDKAQAILDRAEKQDRDLSTTEEAEYDRLLAEVDALIEKRNEQFALERALTDEFVGIYNAPTDNTLERKAAWTQRYAAARGITLKGKERGIMGQPNVISHKLSLNCFRGKEEDAFFCGHWLRALIGRAEGNVNEESEQYVSRRGWGIYATATEGTNSAGGYTVPDPLSAAFIEERKRVSIAMQLADVRSMTSDTMSIPRLTSGPSVSYPGEATSITPVDQVWGQIALTAKKRAILEKISNELLADSVIDLAEQVASRMAYEFSLQLDNEFINGDGTGTYGGEVGLLSALGAAGNYYAGGASNSGKDTWAEIVIDDLTGTMGLLTSEYRRDRAWIMSTAFYFEVALKLVASAGGNTIASVAGGMSDERPMLLGYPVFITDHMPTSTGTGQKSALFGAFSQGVVIGDRSPLQVAVSTDRYFDEDVTAMRGISRYDINVFKPGDGSTAGAYVALSTSST